MSRSDVADATDRAILSVLMTDADASGTMIAERTGLSRNTIRARMHKYEEEHALYPFERRISAHFLGYPLRAFMTTAVVQRQLDAVADHLVAVPEVLEVSGVAGGADLIIQIVARDSDDLYRIAGLILDIPGVVRTETGLVMRELVPYRLAQLLDGAASVRREERQAPGPSSD